MSEKKQQRQNAGFVHCEDIRQQLPAYMLRELGDKQSMLMHDHLLVCEDCRKEAAQFEKMQSILREQRGAVESSGAVLSEKHMKRLRFTAMHPVFDWMYYRHRFVSAACAVLLVVLVVFLLRNFTLFREQELEEGIPIWKMFQSERWQELLERAGETAEDEP